MTHKSEYSYNKIFTEIKNLVNKFYNIDIFNNIIFMSDFEKVLQNSIGLNFSKSPQLGCYFHYIKSLWKKAQMLGLVKHKNIKITKIIIMGLKIFPFIKIAKKYDYIKNIEKYIINNNNIDKSIATFINYFKKNWLNSNFLNFAELVEEEIENRTDNIVEGFNHYLNEVVDSYHPKLSFFVSKIKEIIIIYYNKYIIYQVKHSNISNIRYNIFNDIYNYTTKLCEKYDFNLNFNSLSQLTNDDKEELDKITSKILDDLFGIVFNDLEKEGLDEDSDLDNLDNDNLSDNKIEEKSYLESNINNGVECYEKFNKPFTVEDTMKKKRRYMTYMIMEKINGKNGDDAKNNNQHFKMENRLKYN